VHYVARAYRYSRLVKHVLLLTLQVQPVLHSLVKFLLTSTRMNLDSFYSVNSCTVLLWKVLQVVNDSGSITYNLRSCLTLLAIVHNTLPRLHACVV
jgi:hypothetical protein